MYHSLCLLHMIAEDLANAFFVTVSTCSPDFLFPHTSQEELGIHPLLYMTQWFLCLFTTLPCWDSVLAICDILFLEGEYNCGKGEIIVSYYSFVSFYYMHSQPRPQAPPTNQMVLEGGEWVEPLPQAPPTLRNQMVVEGGEWVEPLPQAPPTLRNQMVLEGGEWVEPGYKSNTSRTID